MNIIIHMNIIILCIAVALLVVIHAEDDIGARPEYCNDGYRGVFCENRCPYPTFGSQCYGRCNCSNEFCHHTTGCRAPADTCPVGFTGKYCKKSCPFPQYGFGCQNKCHCPESCCHFETGCRRQKISQKDLNRKDLSFKGEADEEESTIKPYRSSSTERKSIVMSCQRKNDCRYCFANNVNWLLT